MPSLNVTTAALRWCKHEPATQRRTAGRRTSLWLAEAVADCRETLSRAWKDRLARLGQRSMTKALAVAFPPRNSTARAAATASSASADSASDSPFEELNCQKPQYGRGAR